MMSGKMLLGIAVGLVAGTAIGILFAPESGVETRKKLVKRATDYASGFKDRIGEWAENNLLQLAPGNARRGNSLPEPLSKSQQTKLEDMQTA